MGNAVKKPTSEYQDKEKPISILIVGLHNAGKSTILYRLKLGEFATELPTVGWIGTNMEKIDHNGKNFLLFDYGGRERSVGVPRSLYRRANALLFVVDSSDQEKVMESKDELWRILQNEELGSIPVLVVANKQDLPNAMSTTEVEEKLEVQGMKDRITCVQATRDSTDRNLQDGLSWIQEYLSYQNLQHYPVGPVKRVPAPGKEEHHTFLSKIRNYIFQTPAA